MKKLLLSALLFFTAVNFSQAGEINSLPFDNLKNKAKIFYNQDIDKWSTKVGRGVEEFFIKTVYEGDENYFEYMNSDGTFAFATNCDYDFVNKGRFIGYSNSDLKFYTFEILDGELTKQELDSEAVSELFPNYKVIRISDFSPNTNSIKIKRSNKRIIILNDTNQTFPDYTFSSNNAKFDTYKLRGFLDINKKGMIQFSHYGENSKDFPWFVILVR